MAQPAWDIVLGASAGALIASVGTALIKVANTASANTHARRRRVQLHRLWDQEPVISD